MFFVCFDVLSKYIQKIFYQVICPPTVKQRAGLERWEGMRSRAQKKLSVFEQGQEAGVILSFYRKKER